MKDRLAGLVAFCLIAAASTASLAAGDTRSPGSPETVQAYIQQAKLTGDTGGGPGDSSDLFGYSVAVEGDTAVVAIPGHDVQNFGGGAVNVFVRTGSTWTPQQQLLPTDNPVNSSFGISVAISGETVVVGASSDPSTGAQSQRGSAYVFVRSAGVWTQQQKLLASDGSANDHFGGKVAISGDTVVVGAADDDPLASDSGSAYVFVRSGSTWTQQQKIVPADGGSLLLFGQSVSVSGDTAAIGSGTANGNGSAYVYLRSGSVWSLQQKVLAADGANGDAFGRSVSISGNSLLVGAYGDDIVGFDTGSAYVYVRSGTVWSLQQKLQAADAAALRYFGYSVALSADTAVIGSTFEGNPDAGSTYVFVRSGTVWSQQQKLLATGGAAGDNFGLSVAVSGDTLMSGAPYDADPRPATGSAFVFVRAGSVWSEQQKLQNVGTASGDHFGNAVAIDGNTAVMGAPRDEELTSSQDNGAAYVLVRNGTLWSTQQKLLTTGNVGYNWFGTSVAVSGDTAVVGGPVDNSARGAVYVFVRSGATWTQQAKLVAADGAVNDRLGWSVAIAGDTIAAGAYQDADLGVQSGSAYVFVRNGTTWSQQQKLLAADGTASDQFGHSVSLSGETLAVGAHQDSPSHSNQGSVYVFVRSGTTWTQQQKLLASDPGFGHRLGASVSVSGDTLAAGAPRWFVGATNPGAVYVFQRSGSTWTQQQRLTAGDGAALDEFGVSVSLSGGSLVAGAWLDDDAGTDSGSAYAFSRSGTNWSQQQKLVAADGAGSDDFGVSVALSGTSVLTGAYRDNANGIFESGSAYVFFATDTTPPSNPTTLVSNTHTPGSWSNLASVGAQWSGAADEGGGSGLAGYSILFDASPATLPDAVVDVVHGTDPHATASGPLPDGNSHYFHLRTCDVAGNCGGAIHLGPFWIDTAVPGTVGGLGSSSHGVGAPSTDTTIDAVWTAAADPLSGVDGYGYQFDANPTWVCDQVNDLEETATGVTSGSLADGDWYVHVCTKDNAGNWSAAVDAGPFTVDTHTDLAVSKDDGLTVAVPGQTVVYTIVATNLGPSAVAGAAVTDAFPAAIASVSWTCAAGPGASCSSGPVSGNIADSVTLPPGGSVTYTASATISVTATGSLSNTATVAVPAGATDTNPANNSATDTDTLQPAADLSIVKTDGQATAVPGLPIAYALTVTNGGPSTVTSLTVTDTVPAAIQSPSFEPSAGSYDPGTGTWSGLSLAAGQSATLTLTGTVDPAATSTLTNTAAVAPPAGTADPVPGNNSSTDTDTLTPETDLSIVKTDSRDPVAQGGSFSYTLAMANAGPSAGTGVTVTDPLPAGLSFVSATPGCGNAAGTVTCTLPGLAPGAAATASILVSVDRNALGTAINTANVSGPESDPAPGNNDDTETTALVAAVKGDFTTDGQADIVFRHQLSGANLVWQMDGITRVAAVFTSPSQLADTTWRVVGTADFDDDRKTDLLWRNGVSGKNVVWYMDGVTRTAGVFTNPDQLPDTNWRMVATGDFDADLRSDILWRHAVSGKNVVWYMDGITRSGGVFTSPSQLADTNWTIAGAADFGSDASTDILWRHQASGKIVVWYMDGISRTAGTYTNPDTLADTRWQIGGVAHYNADVKPDILWRHFASGKIVVWYMDGITRTAGVFTSPDALPDRSWMIVGPR